MRNLRRILASSVQNLRKWPSNPRIYAVAALILVFIGSELLPIRGFCMALHLPVTPWVFPFLMSDNVSLTFIMVGLVLIFCDAPFIDQSQPYVIVRSGRRNWFTGQILYIVQASGLYFLFIILVSLLYFIPVIKFSGDWGKVLNTFSMNGTQGVPMFQQQYNINLSFSRYLTANYLPAVAMILSLALSWLEGIFLGLLMFVLNMNFNRIIGTSVALALILLETFAYQFGNAYLALYFSPVSWLNLGVMDATGSSKSPTLWYAAGMLLLFIIVLSFLALTGERKKNIEVLPLV